MALMVSSLSSNVVYSRNEQLRSRLFAQPFVVALNNKVFMNQENGLDLKTETFLSCAEL